MKAGVYLGPAGQLVDVFYCRQRKTHYFSTCDHVWYSFSYHKQYLLKGYRYLGHL